MYGRDGVSGGQSSDGVTKFVSVDLLALMISILAAIPVARAIFGSADVSACLAAEDAVGGWVQSLYIERSATRNAADLLTSQIDNPNLAAPSLAITPATGSGALVSEDGLARTVRSAYHTDRLHCCRPDDFRAFRSQPVAGR